MVLLGCMSVFVLFLDLRPFFFFCRTTEESEEETGDGR
jgi:hypothetical protein